MFGWWYVRKLRSSDYAGYHKAWDRLVKMAAVSRIAPLVADHSHRGEAIRALGRIGSKARGAIDVLLPHLGDDKVRGDVVGALAKIAGSADTKVIERLVPLLRAPLAYDWAPVAIALGKLDWKPSGQLDALRALVVAGDWTSVEAAGPASVPVIEDWAICEATQPYVARSLASISDATSEEEWITAAARDEYFAGPAARAIAPAIRCLKAIDPVRGGVLRKRIKACCLRLQDGLPTSISPAMELYSRCLDDGERTAVWKAHRKELSHRKDEVLAGISSDEGLAAFANEVRDDRWVAKAALARIHGEAALQKFAKETRASELCAIAIERISDQAFLAAVAAEHPDPKIRLIAVNRIDDDVLWERLLRASGISDAEIEKQRSEIEVRYKSESARFPPTATHDQIVRRLGIVKPDDTRYEDPLDGSGFSNSYYISPTFEQLRDAPRINRVVTMVVKDHRNTWNGRF